MERVLAAMNDFEAPAGQVLVQPGREGTGLFVIEDGMVVVALRGRELTLAAGEFFGELALLNPDHLRTARVQAKTDVRGIAIARDDFVPLLHHEPEIAVAMLETLARRLTAATQ